MASGLEGHPESVASEKPGEESVLKGGDNGL